jgi:hypothetical protein
MATTAPTSPYIYMATAFFVLSACSSDLLFIRIALSMGFLGLVLASLSGFSTDGSFGYIPLSEGIIDITMFINMILFCLNVYICIRLIRDEMGRRLGSDEERALYNFFQARCGTTHVEFQEIYKNGKFLLLKKDEKVPKCRCRLYLVCEGLVECSCEFNGEQTAPFMKHSGEFFDIRMFNLFTFPIGFDNTAFQAVTKTDSRLFYWDIEGLNSMRQVPMLNKYWEFTVLRSLAAAGVRHHLKKTDTLYDSLLVPEEGAWLGGAKSRDFFPHQRQPTILRQLSRLASSFQIIPPHGVRHYPRILEPNPMISRMESMCKECVAENSTTEECEDCQNSDIVQDNIP